MQCMKGSNDTNSGTCDMGKLSGGILPPWQVRKEERSWQLFRPTTLPTRRLSRLSPVSDPLNTIILLVDRSQMDPWLHIGYSFLHPLQTVLLERVRQSHVANALGIFSSLWGPNLTIAVAGTHGAFAAVLQAVEDLNDTIHGDSATKHISAFDLHHSEKPRDLAARPDSLNDAPLVVHMPEFHSGDFPLKAGIGRDELLQTGRTRRPCNCISQVFMWNASFVSIDSAGDLIAETERSACNNISVRFYEAVRVELVVNGEIVSDCSNCKEVVVQFGKEDDIVELIFADKSMETEVIIESSSSFEVADDVASPRLRTSSGEKESHSFGKTQWVEIKIDGDDFLRCIDRVALDGVFVDVVNEVGISCHDDSPSAVKKRTDEFIANDKQIQDWFVVLSLDFRGAMDAVVRKQTNKTKRKTIADFLGITSLSLPTITEYPL